MKRWAVRTEPGCDRAEHVIDVLEFCAQLEWSVRVYEIPEDHEWSPFTMACGCILRPVLVAIDDGPEG